ncbi:KIR protein [Plasmodium knowlesi strain H]|uniref:KIR protein n=3 Tax=Plasmodium knowlesi TaxID=5850 RepID=A0A5K1VI80_PLAKH|nr:KIR protein [Plasmodium knowlesi strain H]OTN65765.1 KIR protein [Plasmodium knowlesi]CAA9987804.1 KIR protein [Plasmodium knowlesi strain H]SBO22406.1 KIR protein [Plasmodium knowlesi strain H]SBO29525.1 KIR protein [Plasmodium knowlesi strain H]VVS77278.1 KIR protein [Plasmodium knowlesi strain H]|eukprot:XP_002258801.1 KIR protein [Plasmodium knowlesi strain H]
MGPTPKAPPLVRLPSKSDFYDKFDRAHVDGCSCNYVGRNDWKNNLGILLGKDPGLTAIKDTIANAYCCANKKGKENESNDHWCYFFYYYAGNLFFRNENNRDLANFLDKVYEAFKGTDYRPKCEVKYEDADKINFGLRKRIHDFTYNYNTVQSLIEGCTSENYLKFLRYLQGISGACKIVEADCPEEEERGSGTYCKDYREKYKVYCETKVKELQKKLTTSSPCKPNPNPNQAGSSGSFSDAPQGVVDLADVEDDLNKWLPSKIAYNGIVNNEVTCGDYGNLISGVVEAVKRHSKVDDEANSIAKYFCYAYKNKGSGPWDGSPCSYVYYHVGNTYSTAFDDHESFWKFMGTVSEQLGKLPVDGGNKCQIDLSYTDRKDFIWEKRVYDYYRDHEAVQKKLQDGDSPCSTELDQYLTEAAIGCKLIHRYCNGKTEGEGKAFCDKFKTKYDEHKPEELLGEKCISNLEDEISAYAETSDIISNGESGEDTVSAEIAPIFSFARDGPIASSGLAAVGLPAIAYFLYKYTSLPFWLREQFGGRSNHISRSRRRARRSTGPNFSNFTEDISTEVPTEYSSYLSTLYPLEESIENNSTTYYEEPLQSQPRQRGQQQGHGRRRGPPRRRERANNEYRYGSGQNISYFRM